MCGGGGEGLVRGIFPGAAFRERACEERLRRPEAWSCGEEDAKRGEDQSESSLS